MIDGGEALKGLVTIIGSGGLVTIIGAFLAFRSEAHKGRRGDPEPVAISVASAPQAKSADVEALTNAISLLAGAAIEIAALMKANAEAERLEHEVEDRAEMKALRDALAAAQRRERERDR